MNKNLNNHQKNPMLSVLIAQNNNNNRDSLKRQNSINVPQSAVERYNIKKYPSTPSPTRTSLYDKHQKFFPRSVDSQMLKNRNYSSDQGEHMHFLKVQSPIKTGLPHQYSAESTESANSCVSGVSVTSQEIFPPDSCITSTSELSPSLGTQKGSQEKVGLWPSFKKLLKETKKPIFNKKRKTEVEEAYTDPVYHLLKCGANPDHNPQMCMCDCHGKDDHRHHDSL